MSVTQQFRVVARIEVIQDVWLSYNGLEPKSVSEVVQALRFGQKDTWEDWGAWEQIGDYHNIIMISEPDELDMDREIWEQGITLDEDGTRDQLIEMLEELLTHKEGEAEYFYREREDELATENNRRVDEIKAMIDLLRPEVAEEVGNHGSVQPER